MNTADRSIALMDTALRRRFTFVEMMPNPDVFVKEKNSDGTIKEEITVNGVKIRSLLGEINNRIEYLYDREHTIGHAYFKKFINNAGTVEDLKKTFKNAIIPLLQEYFYDDYEKIALVLGDDKFKSQKDRRFVIEKPVPPVFAGSNFDEGVKYDLNQEIWELSDDDFAARIKAIYEDAEKADVIVCMSTSHADILEGLGIDKLKIFVLGITDPFGGDVDTYRACRDDIFAAIDEFIEDNVL
jgi:hypothetical protein